MIGLLGADEQGIVDLRAYSPRETKWLPLAVIVLVGYCLVYLAFSILPLSAGESNRNKVRCQRK